MLFIFGWKKQAKRIGQVCTANCIDCKKQVPWVVGKLTEWVSLFDVPIIPCKREYFMFCDNCGDDFSLDKQDFKHVDCIMNKRKIQDGSHIKARITQTIENKQLEDKSAIQKRWLEANRASLERLERAD